MSRPIEDYALIGDTQTAGLVSRGGSIDWLCLPRFDSPACFAALLGRSEHGHWTLAPEPGCIARVQRRYRHDSLVLETVYCTPGGSVRVTDCMPPRERELDVVRLVEGLQGTVPMRMVLRIRFDYGSSVPWVSRLPDGRLLAVAGPDALALSCVDAVDVNADQDAMLASFRVKAGQQIPFVLNWHHSHEPPPAPVDAARAIRATETWWQTWAARCAYRGPWREEVVGSLVILKALTYAPTAGIVAAPSCSLPEWPGGARNWDYRYCWLRDATFTLYALLLGGYRNEAAAWRDWLIRAVAGDPAKLQIMYGVGGERRLDERTLPHLPGYADSVPVRVGNAAVQQRQLDVFGEIMDVLHQAYRAGLQPDGASWRLQQALMAFLERQWDTLDAGLWEVRSAPRHFTHSKLMAWVAFDRAVKACQRWRVQGPVARWMYLRDTLKADICLHAWNTSKQAFVQAYGSSALDASVLLMPQVGFLPATDPRMIATVRAIERELVEEGFVCRYRTDEGVDVDGLPPGEGTFIACSFWLADCYALMGRTDDALAMFRRLLRIRNDVGLLAEQYDPARGRMLGNFPQAFSHVGLVNTAFNLTAFPRGPASDRGRS